MSDETQEVNQTTTRVGDTVSQRTETKDSGQKADHKVNVAERAVWYVAGILLFVLGLRFVLSLLGANRSNGFADFVYSISHPFVAPFFSLFNYNLDYGVSRFEIFTLVAMAVYAAVAFGIAKLVTISRD